jgi:DNA replication protein DnaC
MKQWLPVQIEKVPFDDEMNLYERALSVPILVLDELKLRTEAKGVEQYCEMLIRRRIDDKKCTIITTNHAPSVIKEKYPALYAPLMESVLPVKIEGHDFRKAIAERK